MRAKRRLRGRKDGKWGNVGFGGPKKLFRLCSFARNTDQKGIFHCYSIICSIISSFYIVIDSVTRSSRDNYNFVLSSCKLKFLTYHLRQQFSRDLSGNVGNAIGSMMIGIAIDQTISAFRFPTRFREIFSGPKNYFRDIKSLLHFWWVCPCVIYNDSYIHSFSPSRGAIPAARLST